jgi:hypothetical protein
MLPVQFTMTDPIPHLPLAFSIYPLGSLMIMGVALIALLAVVRAAWAADRRLPAGELSAAVIPLAQRRPTDSRPPSGNQPLAA